MVQVRTDVVRSAVFGFHDDLLICTGPTRRRPHASPLHSQAVLTSCFVTAPFHNATAAVTGGGPQPLGTTLSPGLPAYPLSC